MRKVFNILLFTLLFLTFENVYAEEQTVRRCVNGKQYQIDYNDQYVGLADLTNENILAGSISAHSGDDNYKIVVVATEDTCDHNNFIAVCPTVETLNKFKQGGEYYTNNLIANDLVKITYNMYSRVFDIKIAKELGDKYYIRKVPSLAQNGDTQSVNNKFYPKTFYPNTQYIGLSNNSYNTTGNIGQVLMLEFYEKSGDCVNSFISSQVYEMPAEDEITIDNPALKSGTNYYTLCNNNIKNNPNYLNDETSRTIKQVMAPFCYSNTLTVNEYNNFQTLLDEAKGELDKVFDGVTGLDDDEGPNNTDDRTDNGNKCSAGNGKVKCDGSTSNSTSYNIFSNADFRVKCTDTYSFKGYKPKLTVAGGGFEYGSNLSYNLKRVCEIIFIGSPAVKPPPCSCQCSAVSTWNGTPHPNEPNGGPNEDFDACVNKCDGGTYSQSCINSCYKEIYGDDTKRTSAIEKMSTLLLNIETKGKVKTLQKKEGSSKVLKTGIPGVEVPGGIEVVPGGRGETPAGNAGTSYNLRCPNGQEVIGGVQSDWCASGNGTVVWSCTIGPSGCSNDPDGDYDAALGRKHANLAEAQSKMNDALQAGNVSLNIVDTYLKNSNGSYYKFSINDTSSNIKINKSVNRSSVAAPSGSATLGASGSSRSHSASASWSGFGQQITVSNIRIDSNAYVGKLYGNVVYNQGSRSYSITKNSGGNYGVNPFDDFNEMDYYNGNASNGNPQYFTNLYTDNFNVIKDSTGNIKLNLDCYNIEVKVTGVGTSRKKYSFTNSCYYGVYNNYVYKPEPCDPEDCPPGDDGEGKKYIFRPIELTDVFPEREPRWNWTNDATLSLNGRDKYLGYNVNPEKTTEHIEDEGHRILNDANRELDYEIIIDRMGIARIKGFNKDMQGYTNFDLNCNMRNVTLCMSNFLDSASYIRNAGNTRKGDSLLSKNGWER